MIKENVIKTKSYAFALEMVMLHKILRRSGEYILSRQLLRSATSVGANIEEAIQGQSKRDFIHKLSISQKEIFESNYWLRLLRDSGYLASEKATSLLEQCEEIQRIITAILVTAKKNR